MTIVQMLIAAKVAGGSGSGTGITDVQVNGTSVVSGGVANVPVGSGNNLGVLRVASGGSATGLSVQPDGRINVYPAQMADIKKGDTLLAPITGSNQHLSAFYGFAKAAGADMKNIQSTTVGVYPEAQKSAISTMLHAPETVTGTTPTITALAGVQYVCGEVATLDITLPASGCADVRFESGSTPTVLTITPPSGVTVKWAGGFDHTALEANTVYEIRIRDGIYASALKWA